MEATQGKSIVSQRYDIEKTRKQGNNSLRIADIKADILDSGATSIYIKMGLTGKDIRIDEEGNEVVGDDLDVVERMKCLKTVCDYVIPKAERIVVDSESTVNDWRKAMVALEQTDSGIPETEKTP